MLKRREKGANWGGKRYASPKHFGYDKAALTGPLVHWQRRISTVIPVKSIPEEAKEGSCVPSSRIKPDLLCFDEYSSDPFLRPDEENGAPSNTVSSDSLAFGKRAGVSGIKPSSSNAGE